MDGSRFDHFARSLAGKESRRGFLGGMLGLSTGLLGVRVTDAGSDRPEVVTPCPPGQDGRKGRCWCKNNRRPPVGGLCPPVCWNTILAGGPVPTDIVFVDDDLAVYLAGVLAFLDDNGGIGEHPPIALGATGTGSQLRVVATNSPTVCGEERLNPLYLHCLDTGAVQVLDSDGFSSGTEQPCGEVFYDQTFTVAW